MGKQGYVYILTNPSFREDWVKIGYSSVSVEQRVKQLDGTSVPLPFEIYATMRTAKFKEAEKLIHNFISMFTNLRIRENREFFNVKPEKALEVFKHVAKVIDDAVIEETYKESLFGDGIEEGCNGKTKSGKTPPRDEIKKWMIPASQLFFDLAGCLKKSGYVYWKQCYNFQKDDIVYVYITSPECKLMYKCIVEAHDLPFSDDNAIIKEFFVDSADYETYKQGDRYVKLRLETTTNSDKLTLIHLLENGMKAAPRGCLNLSYAGYAELLSYVESNF